jgi:membrane associated rhomboid family serine protease
MIPIQDTVQARGVPLVTWSLILLNGLVFLYEVSLPPEQLQYLIVMLGFVPARVGVDHATSSLESERPDSLGSSLLPTIVRFIPICTATGVPPTSIVVLPLRYQPKEPVENSFTIACIGTLLIVTVTGLALAWNEDLAQWIIFTLGNAF